MALLQFLQTLALGSQPTATGGGTNPRQVGMGTMVSDITPDFNQGTLEISSNPTDLAIQGDGFFMVEGDQGETLYTRNGMFKFNSDNEMVTITGNRLLGYGVNLFLFASGRLTPHSAPLTVKGITDHPDPLPQALVLTAIVIGIAVSAAATSRSAVFAWGP